MRSAESLHLNISNELTERKFYDVWNKWKHFIANTENEAQIFPIFIAYFNFQHSELEVTVENVEHKEKTMKHERNNKLKLHRLGMSEKQCTNRLCIVSN